MIEARDISVRIGTRTLLRDVSMRIMPGRVTALLGPNGAGKSTLVSVLTGERKASAGTTTIDGCDMHTLTPLELARQRAVLLQNSSLDFAFTVDEVVGLGRLPFAATNDAFDDEDALDDVRRVAGISPLWQQLYQTLSGGERQRVQFARALAQIWRRNTDGLPRYLFLDEPTSALDLRHRRTVLETAAKLAADGIGVLVVLHDLNLAADFADDVVLLRDGKVQISGTVDDVLTEKHLSACFDIPIEVMSHTNGKRLILA
tara:strand:- start:3665 stop:4441 length:777 start_codon:yes stop_codon:yes gene_type:complete